ncbi:thiamine diphosphokinase [uncultured Jannaschia sp.]|uniref:thiamine diphosphokinase n=1 Tax=uncultured Jannaschia sp. TaxID=293347 RepID=UPI00260EC04C|nr:thiamine diphosphokinase [uncultured Jannaschia sp.]
MPDSKPTVHRSVPFAPSGQTLVGGGPVSMPVLDEALSRAPRLIAADGGADALLTAGHVPDAVIGDMDSVSGAARAAFADRLVPIAEQDSTDFAKALRTAPAAFTLAVGFLGGRTDHTLACLTELARSGAPVVLLDAVDAIACAPADLALDLSPGTRVSLWPMGRVTGRSEGLQWPIDGLVLTPDGRVGTSNRATGPVRLHLEGPCLVLVPASALGALMEGLQFGPVRAEARSL